MKSASITLDDPSVRLQNIRSGRAFSHTIPGNGFHLELRMNSDCAFPKSFNLNPGADDAISQLYLEGTHRCL